MIDKNREFNKLIPEYLNADFDSSLTKNVDLLKKDNTFKDYNYHGANMTMILELLSYLTDFSSFHTNMVAKNNYMESANVYETVHGLSLLKGYYPLGTISSYTTITCEISASNGSTIYISDGDQLVIEPWMSIDTGAKSVNDTELSYNTTSETIIDVDDNNNPLIDNKVEFNFYMKEGDIERFIFNHNDMIDNEIILPFHSYDYGNYPFIVPSIFVSINDEEWIRVHDFYDYMSGLENDIGDKVYMFVYDKYHRNILRFDTSREVPEETDFINVNVLRSNGANGAIGAEVINMPGLQNFVIKNITKNIIIPNDQILTFINKESSVGGSLPENIEDIKVSSRANIHSQYRNVTSKDYRYYLESRTDVEKGYAWGEQEVDPGNILEYNKVYISVIPPKGYDSLFAPGSINTIETVWTEKDDTSLSAPVEIPDKYNVDFRNDLLKFLEPRKMLNCYEIPILPNIVYFRFDIGIRIKRTYTYTEVHNDVRDKLIYYFKRTLREYKEDINFMNIHNFIMDQSITSETSIFENIKGLDNLVLREISTFTYFLEDDPQTIYEPNDNNLYPMYKKNEYEGYIDNKLRTIQLGYDQFPMLVIDMCRFYAE